MGPQNETPNAENYKQKVKKPALFCKKKLHFSPPNHLGRATFCVFPCQIWPFFLDFLGPLFGPKLERGRARARASCCSGDVFFDFLLHTSAPFGFRARTPKSPVLKGKRFSKNRPKCTWVIFWPFFSPKKSYYSLVIRPMFSRLINRFGGRAFGPAAYR